MKIVDIWINCPDEAAADRIAEGLMAERLIACANRYPPIESRYFWKGGIERETEVPLLVKTRATLFEAVAEAARALHPYETPSILGVEVAMVNREYADRIVAETRELA